MSTIIAVDLGRHKSVACVSDRRTGAHAFRDLDTTPGAIDRRSDTGGLAPSARSWVWGRGAGAPRTSAERMGGGAYGMCGAGRGPRRGRP